MNKIKIFKMNNEKKRKLKEVFILLLPWIIGMLVFFMYPLYKSFIISFGEITKMDGLKIKWIGLEHYEQIILKSISFKEMILSTLKEIAINAPLIVLFSLFIAILLNNDFKGRGFFRSVCVIPFLLGSGYVMQFILGLDTEGQATSATINTIMIPKEALVYIGPRIAELVQGFLGRITYILWKSGVQIVIFLGALQSVSGSLYESADCDGATRWEMFWFITLPMIVHQILLTVVYTLVDLFTSANNPVVRNLYYELFENMETTQYEYNSAKMWLYATIVILIVVMVYSITTNIEKRLEK